MNQPKYTGLGIALGAAAGAVAGVMAGHIAIWLGLGVAIGLVIGSVRSKTSDCPACAEVHQNHAGRELNRSRQ